MKRALRLLSARHLFESPTTGSGLVLLKNMNQKCSGNWERWVAAGQRAGGDGRLL